MGVAPDMFDGADLRITGTSRSHPDMTAWISKNSRRCYQKDKSDRIYSRRTRSNANPHKSPARRLGESHSVMFDEKLPVANVALEDRENRKQEAGSGTEDRVKAKRVLYLSVLWDGKSKVSEICSGLLRVSRARKGENNNRSAHRRGSSIGEREILMSDAVAAFTG